MLDNLLSVIKDIDFSLIPSIFPLSICFLGFKKMFKVVFMERYKLFDEMIQQRLFLENMDYDLLIKGLNILKKEKNRRFKIKVNNFLKFRFFKV